tara:strand:- start:4439 stop:4921 length:483 start_codon:yes stop_codon:yes gene_type:complete
MENLEIKQILLQLEKQDDDLKELKNGLTTLLKNNDGESMKKLNQQTLKVVDSFVKKHAQITQQIVSARKTAEKIQVYFDGIFSNLPLAIKHQLVIRGKIKWQIYLLIAFSGLVITTCFISYYNYKDTTDYEKAWNALIEVQPDETHKKRLLNFLKEYQND